MSKIKIKLKLTGFELEIEGSKDDIPQIQQAIGQQIGSLLQPGTGYLDEAPQQTIKTIGPETVTAPTRSSRPRKRVASSSAVKSSEAEGTGPLAKWPSDVSKKPSCWFLTEAGIAVVEKRIAELKSSQGK